MRAIFPDIVIKFYPLLLKWDNVLHHENAWNVHNFKDNSEHKKCLYSYLQDKVLRGLSHL